MDKTVFKYYHKPILIQVLSNNISNWKYCPYEDYNSRDFNDNYITVPSFYLKETIDSTVIEFYIDIRKFLFVKYFEIRIRENQKLKVNEEIFYFHSLYKHINNFIKNYWENESIFTVRFLLEKSILESQKKLKELE